WRPECGTAPPPSSCGFAGAPCGTECTNTITCNDDAQCDPGDVCGRNNGAAFDIPFGRACWKVGCNTDPVATGCGTVFSACGKCQCAASCANAQCGAGNSDGCGGRCLGVCADRQPGCTADADCAPTSACVKGGGPRIGLPVGTNVCLPARC